MKSITTYITEKMVYTKANASKYKYYPKTKEDYFEYILNIIKKKNLENIDTYDNGLLVPDLFLDENMLVDNIQFDEKEITIFYRDNSNRDSDLGEENKSFEYDKWYEYFDEDMTKSIYNYLMKHIKNKML